MLRVSAIDCVSFFFNDTATTEIYTLSLHDALPISENVALWHERDISHSSVERVTLPDATILIDYAQSLALRLVTGMTVREDRMLANLEATHGALYSQRALLALVESGRTRDEAYRIVQEHAQRAWDTGTHFRDLLAEAAPELDLDAIFDPGA